MNTKRKATKAPTRQARGIKMEPDLWAFCEERADDLGERSASSLIRRWVLEKHMAAERRRFAGRSMGDAA